MNGVSGNEALADNSRFHSPFKMFTNTSDVLNLYDSKMLNFNYVRRTYIVKNSVSLSRRLRIHLERTETKIMFSFDGNVVLDFFQINISIILCVLFDIALLCLQCIHACSIFTYVHVQALYEYRSVHSNMVIDYHIHVHNWLLLLNNNFFWKTYICNTFIRSYITYIHITSELS